MEEKMGSKFVEGRSVEFSKSYEESSPSTPIFFILSPGVDPLKDVEALGKHHHRNGPPWKHISKSHGGTPELPRELGQNQKLARGAGVENQACQWEWGWRAGRG